MATYAKLGYNGKVQTVALYEGLGTEELTSLLKAVFSVEGTIVGIMAEKGLVLPISLVSKAPSVVPNTLCMLIVSNTSGSKAPIASKQSSKAVTLDSMPSDLAVEDSNMVSEADSSEVVTSEITEFIEGLRERSFLSAAQAALLNSLLASNSTLLFAAYSVAISANDSEYLAEICKDLAQSLVTEQGRSACEAQDEVLQVSDQLYINNRISENQLLYLRHLVLIREEVVAKIYDQFQEDGNVPKLAKALYELCNTHPYQHARQQQQQQAQQQGQEGSEGSEEEEDEEEEQQQPKKQRAHSNAQLGLSGVVSLMMRSQRLTSAEASVLLELIRAQNEYVMAAYELYESDEKIDELQDTLLRCAKLELRKRLLEAREVQLDAQYQQRMTSKYDAAEDATEEEGDEEEEEDDDEEVEEEDEEEQDDENDEADERFTLEDIGVDSILESLDVVNIWESTVPAKFVKTVFIAVIRKQLDIYQAKALCDLYHANYDLVRSAWEVYTVQEDANDLLDTLRRVVKDLTLDEDDDEEGLASSDGSDMPTQAATSKPAASKPAAPKSTAQTTAKAPEKAAEKPAEAPARAAAPAAGGNTAASNHAAAQAAMDRKQEALAAVAQAKRDLLKHSLEMMVKQSIITGESAANLYRRYLQGDTLAEAAIDAYATDRNVAEFLDTLQILANHTPDELSEMMKDVAEEAAENAVSGSPTAANTRANAHISPSASARAAPAASKSVVPPTGPVPVPVATAQLQLKGIVAELARNQMITAEVHSILNRLVSEADRRLITAFAQYTVTQEGAKLIDTLLHVAAAEVALLKPRSPTAARTAQASQQTAEEQEESESDGEGDEEEDEAQGSAGDRSESLLTASDQKTVVDILARANALSAPHAAMLHARVDAGDAHLKGVFSKYETDKDVYQLIDALKALQLEEQSEEEEEDDEEEEAEEELDEDDGATIESRFLQIVQRMHLTHLETAALRLAIARDDAAVKQAIEAFRSTLNENVLMATLREIARDTIRETMAEQEAEDEEGQDGDNEEEDGEPQEEAESEEDDEDEDEEDGDDEDDEEEEDDRYGNSAESREVDELIRRYSQYNTTSNTSSSTQSAHSAGNQSAIRAESKTSSPGGTSHYSSSNRSPQQQSAGAGQEARSKAYAGAYDYKMQDAQDEQSEEEDEQSEEDEEEDEEEADHGRSLVTSQAARNHVFPILVSELVKENILSARQGTSIMKQFAEGSAVISAAIDVYDRDSDLGHLVQTLQNTVEHTR